VTVFGVLSLPIYSLVVAHANDHLQKEQVLGASAKLVLLYGVGSLVGPILVGYVMRRVGGEGFLVYMAIVHAMLAGFAAWRRLRGPGSFKAQAAEAMQVSPVTTPPGAQALRD
jgi:predicted MFS family arabinose efflux permease